MSSVNADSMTNAQGEFQPSRPRDEPLTTKGHQVGQKTSPADDAPEFSTKVLPAGSAPASKTFQPNPVSETPGQAANPDAIERTDAQDTLGGATSAEVHQGYGHPGEGQTSSELRHEGKHTSKREGAGMEGLTTGGSGLRDDGNSEARRLASENSDGGAISGYNVSRDGAETLEPTTAEAVAAERR